MASLTYDGRAAQHAQSAHSRINHILEYNPIARRSVEVKWEALSARGLVLSHDGTAVMNSRDIQTGAFTNVRDLVLVWQNFARDMWACLNIYGYATVAVRQCMMVGSKTPVRIPTLVPPNLYFVLDERGWMQYTQSKKPWVRRSIGENWRAVFHSVQDRNYYVTAETGEPMVFCLFPPGNGNPDSPVIRLLDLHQKYMEHLRAASVSALRNSIPQGFYSDVSPPPRPGVLPGIHADAARAALDTEPFSTDAVMQSRMLHYEQMYMQREHANTRRQEQILESMNRAILAPQAAALQGEIGPAGSSGGVTALFPAGRDVSVDWVPASTNMPGLDEHLNHLKQGMCTIMGVPPPLLHIPMPNLRAGVKDTVTMTVWQSGLQSSLEFMNLSLATVARYLVYNAKWRQKCVDAELQYKGEISFQLLGSVALDEVLDFIEFLTPEGRQNTLSTLLQLPVSYFHKDPINPPPATAGPRSKPKAKRKATSDGGRPAKR